MNVYEMKIGDRLVFKKKHPCGSNEWIIEKMGVEMKLKCAKCDRIIIMPRAEIEKHIKK